MTTKSSKVAARASSGCIEIKSKVRKTKLGVDDGFTIETF